MGSMMGSLFGMGQSGVGDIQGTLGSWASAFGANANAKAINRAGAASLQAYQDKTYLPQLMAMIQGGGAQGLNEFLAMTSKADQERYFGADKDYTSTKEARLGEIDKRLAEIKGERGGAKDKAARDRLDAEKSRLEREYKDTKTMLKNSPSKGMYDLDAIKKSAEGKKGFFDEYDSALSDTRQSYQDVMNRYDADTGVIGAADRKTLADYDAASRIFGRQGAQDLSRAQYQTGDLVGTAKQYGKGREEIIRRDTQRGLDNANAGSTADMIASGLGASTLTQNAKAQNARTYGDIQNNALQSLNDSQAQAVMGAKQWGFGNENAVNQANRGRMFQREGGRTALQDSQTRALDNRLTGGTALQGQIADRNAPLRQQGSLLRAQYFQSPMFNPYLGMDMTRYFPGASPTGAFLTSLGNSYSQMGAQNVAAGGSTIANSGGGGWGSLFGGR